MREIVRVIRLHPEGSAESGMGPWQIVDHDNVISPNAKDRAVEMVNRELIEPSRVRVGIWEAQPYKEKLVNYQCNEFMHVIEGSCTIIEEDGRKERFSKGDSFFMPLGFNGIWEQEETMKKYYMIVEPTKASS